MRNRLSKIKGIDLLIYISTIILAAILILGKEVINIDLLMPILKPVTLIVEAALGISFDYHRGIGFYNEELAIMITRKCAGVNFLTTLFLMLIFSFAIYVDESIKKLIAVVFFFIYAYILTIVANASRIIGIVYMMKVGMFSNMRYENLLHQSTGVVFYFTYLVIAYFLINRFFRGMEDVKDGKNI